MIFMCFFNDALKQIIEGSPKETFLLQISSLREITGGGGCPVSPTVKFGLMNVMYAYAFTHRLYRGSLAEDPDNLAEFPGVVLTICGSLRTPRPQNFDSAEMALQAAVTSVVENGAFLQTSDEEAKKVCCPQWIMGVGQNMRASRV